MEILFFAVAAVFLIAAITDIMAYRIPNWCSIAVILAYVVRCIVAWDSVDPLWDLLAAAIAFAVGFGLYSFGKFGAGDVKLATVGVLWAGWGDPALVFVLATALFGGVLAILVLLARVIYSYRHYIAWLEKSLPNLKDIPYGVAIACGAIVLILTQTQLITLPVS